ncbi:MAG: GIY-YIG nuclease family protein [Sarcina sp.]
MEFENRETYGKEKGIYGILNIKTDKYYIGQTIENFNRRYLHHNWSLKNGKGVNSYIQKSFNKHGCDNFKFVILHVLKDGEDIDELERYYISLYQTYNIQSGGQDRTNHGNPLSEEHKRKIGEANKIRNTGKKASESTKKKMSETRTGKSTNCKNDYSVMRKAKIMLMVLMSPMEVANILNVDYKVINNLYSNNTYKSVYVEGWEEFFKNRPRKNRK